MSPVLACPVCATRDFINIGSATFSKGALDRERRFAPHFHVLFELWCSGAEDAVMTYKACVGCGFVFYAPRPDEADMSAKYTYFSEYRRAANKKQGTPETVQRNAVDVPHNAATERERAKRLYADVTKLVNAGKPIRILDFGGGDGRLMHDFLRSGHLCYLVDLWSPYMPEVVKLGDTLDHLSGSERFDVIVCSHIIEHVVNPRELLTRLATHLSPHGLVFIEVPMEIWGKPPIHREPVTHVNFFTPASMSRLLHESGLRELQSRLSSYLTPLGDEKLAVKAAARRASRTTPPPPRPGGLKQTLAFLAPGLREKCWRYAAAPRQLGTAIRAKFS